MEFGACSKNAYVNRKNIKTEERNEIKRKNISESILHILCEKKSQNGIRFNDYYVKWWYLLV